MRVLFLDQYSDLGGAQRMLLDLLPAVEARGWQVSMGLPGNGELVDRARARGAEVFAIPCGSYSSGRKSAADLLRFQAETPQLAVRIREKVEQFAPDLVYLNGPRLLPATALARVRRPVLFHAHNAVSQRAARLLAGVPLRLLKAEVVAVCRHVAASWQSYVPATRITVVYNGVAGPERGVSDGAGPPRLGCIGRIGPEKGQREFLASACRIRGAFPDARFVIAGAALFSDPAALSYEQAIRSAAARMPVEFTGWVDDVYAVMAQLDLLLVPSVWNEPNPRVILEAFAAGLPVLAFRRGGIPEIIEDGRTGFLCDTPSEMAQRAIELLQGGRERLHAVSEAARESWCRQFRLETWQQRMITEMERCAS